MHNTDSINAHTHTHAHTRTHTPTMQQTHSDTYEYIKWCTDSTDIPSLAKSQITHINKYECIKTCTYIPSMAELAIWSSGGPSTLLAGFSSHLVPPTIGCGQTDRHI